MIAKLRRELKKKRRRREEVERQRNEKQQQREKAEKRIRKTTVSELLDACHTYLFLNFIIQKNITMSTQDNSVNATNKMRSDKIQFRQNFLMQHKAI